MKMHAKSLARKFADRRSPHSTRNLEKKPKTGVIGAGPVAVLQDPVIQPAIDMKKLAENTH
jgi:hypothetical protein